jgi:hypothetical protein
MLYNRYAQNDYRDLLKLNSDTFGTNMKGEFVLWNLITDTNFVTFLKKDISHSGKDILLYKLSPEGANLGKLICTKQPENVETAKQISKKYDGEKEELPKEYYQAELEKAKERIYFLESKIKDFRQIMSFFKEKEFCSFVENIQKLLSEYKV